MGRWLQALGWPRSRGLGNRSSTPTLCARPQERADIVARRPPVPPGSIPPRRGPTLTCGASDQHALGGLRHGCVLAVSEAIRGGRRTVAGVGGGFDGSGGGEPHAAPGGSQERRVGFQDMPRLTSCCTRRPCRKTIRGRLHWPRSTVTTEQRSVAERSPDPSRRRHASTTAARRPRPHSFVAQPPQAWIQGTLDELCPQPRPRQPCHGARSPPAAPGGAALRRLRLPGPGRCACGVAARCSHGCGSGRRRAAAASLGLPAHSQTLLPPAEPLIRKLLQDAQASATAQATATVGGEGACMAATRGSAVDGALSLCQHASPRLTLTAALLPPLNAHAEPRL